MNLFDSQQADELGTLLAIAESGSFAAASRTQNRHPSVLSKRLSSLERRLGIRLVERTTRQLRLTDEGMRLVEKVRQATDLLIGAQNEASESATHVRGRLRLSLPAVMGRQWLSQIVAGFSLAYPDVKLDVEYSDRMVDIVGERFDAAVRIGELPDSRLVATRLHRYRRILAASPDYLDRHGSPLSPSDLADHNCLGFTGLATHPEWVLLQDRYPAQQEVRPFSLTVRGSIVSNDNEALLTAAAMGVGIVGGGDWFLGPHIASGALVRVLPQWQLGNPGGIYFVRPSAEFSPAAMRVFQRWIVDRFARLT